MLLSFLLLPQRHATVDSLWHGADRLLAWPLTILQIVKVYLMMTDGSSSWGPSAVYLAIVVVALACRWQSRRARLSNDAPGYVRWHSLWHVTMPLGAVCHASAVVGGWL